MRPLLEKLPVFRWHERNIYGSRVQRLSTAIADLAGSASSMLDVGCGDGSLAKDVASRVGATDLRGVDIKLRKESFIDVKEYDGEHLPFESGRFDLVTINDVLHHAEKPQAVLAECIRVLRPGGKVVVKDHFRLGTWSNTVLLAMDVVGNYAPGVFVRGNYLSPPEWVDLVANAGGAVDRLVWPLTIHSLPWRMVARSEYQFMMRIRARTADKANGAHP